MSKDLTLELVVGWWLFVQIQKGTHHGFVVAPGKIGAKDNRQICCCHLVHVAPEDSQLSILYLQIIFSNKISLTIFHCPLLNV